VKTKEKISKAVTCLTVWLFVVVPKKKKKRVSFAPNGGEESVLLSIRWVCDVNVCTTGLWERANVECACGILNS
jgi:hypothetical protein